MPFLGLMTVTQRNEDIINLRADMSSNFRKNESEYVRQIDALRVENEEVTTRAVRAATALTAAEKRIKALETALSEFGAEIDRLEPDALKYRKRLAAENSRAKTRREAANQAGQKPVKQRANRKARFKQSVASSALGGEVAK